MNMQIQFNRDDPRSSPPNLLHLLPGTRWEWMDSELIEIMRTFSVKASRARATAKKARERGDMVKWKKFNAVARVWEMAARDIDLIGCPF